MRTIVAYVCLDEHGKYSIDAPGPDQGGTMGFGTTSVDGGELAPSMRLLEDTLRSWEPILLLHIGRKALETP